MNQSMSGRRPSSVKQSTAHHPSSDNGKQTAGCCFHSHFLKYFCLQCLARCCNEKHLVVKVTLQECWHAFPFFVRSRTMLKWEALGKNTSAFAQYKLFHNLFDVKFKSVFKYIVGNIYFNWRKKIAFDDFLKYFFCGSPSKVILQDWYLRSVQAPWDYETKICCQLGKCRSVMQLQISNFFT